MKPEKALTEPGGALSAIVRVLSRVRKPITVGFMQDRVLFHYTSLDASLHILREREIWASSLRFLSDSEEFAYAAKLFRDEIALAATRYDGTDELWRSLRLLLELLEDRVQQWPEHMIDTVSFSGNGDLLSQWRAYCPERRGISLGFAQSALKTAAGTQDFQLRKCLYDERRQRHLLRALLERAIDRFITPRSDDTVSSWATACVDEFTQVAPRLKHPSFSEEQEWRLIGRVAKENLHSVRYRVGTSIIVPYVAVKLPPLTAGDVLVQIKVGPTPHARLALDAVITFLYTTGIHHVETSSARSPYRSW